MGKLPAWMRFLIAVAVVSAGVVGYQTWLNWPSKQGAGLAHEQHKAIERGAKDDLVVFTTTDKLQCDLDEDPRKCGRRKNKFEHMEDFVERLVCFKATVPAAGNLSGAEREFCFLSRKSCEEGVITGGQSLPGVALSDCYILRHRD